MTTYSRSDIVATAWAPGARFALAHLPRKVWSVNYRRAETNDVDDFKMICLHETFPGAQKAAEMDAKADGHVVFEWWQHPEDRSWRYSLGPESDGFDFPCYLLEECPVQA